MACTNLVGWPGYRWGRGPDWTTTGVIRPVTEIDSSVSVAVDDFTCLRADEVFVDPAFTLQTARAAVWGGAAVMDLAGRVPAIRHDHGAALPGGLIRHHRRHQSHRGIEDSAPVGTFPHAAFHRGHVEIFDHDLAVGARQLCGELVGCFPP